MKHRDHEIDIELRLRAAARDDIAAAGPGDGDADRDELELLGLLSYELEPTPPTAELRRRVLAAATSEAPAASSAASIAASGPPIERPAAERRSRRRPARRGVDRLLPVAAALALVSLAATGWLALRLAAGTELIAELEQRLAAAERQVETTTLARSELASEGDRLRHDLARVTSPGIEVCPLRPVGERPAQPRARALMFIADAEGTWYLRLAELEAPPTGHRYMLWFLGDDGAVPGGVVHASGGPIDSGRLPPARAMSRGVAVTLESAAAVARPLGPMVLFGDEKMDLL